MIQPGEDSKQDMWSVLYDPCDRGLQRKSYSACFVIIILG
uniref:Uncharacterized protein n=1 Tax=Setaria italica TaxID=4555 RepID=K3XTH8_SETIT